MSTGITTVKLGGRDLEMQDKKQMPVIIGVRVRMVPNSAGKIPEWLRVQLQVDPKERFYPGTNQIGGDIINRNCFWKRIQQPIPRFLQSTRSTKSKLPVHNRRIGKRNSHELSDSEILVFFLVQIHIPLTTLTVVTTTMRRSLRTIQAFPTSPTTKNHRLEATDDISITVFSNIYESWTEKKRTNIFIRRLRQKTPSRRSFEDPLRHNHKTFSRDNRGIHLNLQSKRMSLFRFAVH